MGKERTRKAIISLLPSMALDKTTISEHHQKLRKSTAKLVILPLALIITGAIFISLTHDPDPDPAALISLTHDPDPAALDANSANSLKIFCSVTFEPETCFASISTHLIAGGHPVNAVKGFDPDGIFTASLKAAIHNISGLPPLARRVLVGSGRIGAESVLDHCERGFGDALTALSRLLRESQRDPGGFEYQALTPERKEEVVTRLIKGTSGLDICEDVLDEMALNDLSVKVFKAKVRMNNCLSFLHQKDSILEKIQSAHQI